MNLFTTMLFADYRHTHLNLKIIFDSIFTSVTEIMIFIHNNLFILDIGAWFVPSIDSA